MTDEDLPPAHPACRSTVSRGRQYELDPPGTKQVRISIHHGRNCTCRKLDPPIYPVIVDPQCPAVRAEPRPAVRRPRTLEPLRRITITWPKASPDGNPLMSYAMTVHDYDTGEQILTATGLSIVLGGAQWDGGPVVVDLTVLVDADGKPLAPADPPVLEPDGCTVRTGVFRYWVVSSSDTAAEGT